MTCGSGTPHSRLIRRLLARWTSMKLRCRPASLAERIAAPSPRRRPWSSGCPRRPPASPPPPSRGQRVACRLHDTAQASRPRRIQHVAGAPHLRSGCWPAADSAPGRCGPLRRSAWICSCCTRSKPCRSSSAARLCAPPSVSSAARGSRRSNSVLHHARKLRRRAAGGAEAVEFGAPRRRKQPRLRAQQRGHRQRVVARRHQRAVAAQQTRPACRAR